MRVLVTGGAGFLGSHLVDALVAAGDEVIVLDNLYRGSPANIDPHLRSGAVKFIEGDIRDYAAVLEAAAGVDVVYHLAAQSNVIGALKDTDYSFTTNVAGTYNVLKAAASPGCVASCFPHRARYMANPIRYPYQRAPH